MRGWRSTAATLALALVTSSCFGGSGGDPSVLLVATVTGPVQTRAVGGDWAAASQGQKLSSGDRVRVAPGGSVVLQRGDESVVEVRPNGTAPAELAVSAVDRVNLLNGDVLVASSKAAPVAVESGGIAAEGDDAVFRFDRRLSVRVGVYEGAATIAAAGATLPVPSFREGIVSARLLPRSTRPLALNPEDPWDVRFLGDVIELNAELDAQHRGYEAAFGRRTTVADLERLFGSGLALGRLGFTRPFLSSSTHGNVLTGLALAALLVKRDGGTAAGVFEQVMTLREQGASWGLIARMVSVDGNELLDAFVRAVGLRTGEVTSTPGVIGSGGGGRGGGGGGGGDPTPTPTSSKRSTPGPSPSPSPSGSTSPSPSPSPSPSESLSPSPSPTCILLPPLCNPTGDL